MTLQEKVRKAKNAVKSAGFVAFRRAKPDHKGGVWVYALIPIPFSAHELALPEDDMQKLLVRWIRDRCSGPGPVAEVGVRGGKRKLKLLEAVA